MKEEYLWDKTGEDEEIRELEETLAVFRHRPGEAPRLRFEYQSATIPSSSWKTFSLRFAFAFSAIAVAVVGAWSVLQRNFPADGVETVFVAVPTDAEPIFEQRKADESFTPQSAITVPDSPAKIPAVRESRMAVRIVSKSPNQAPARKVQRFTLTAEEQFAYDEVRKALSISSEKFRIVKDTINGNDGTARTDVR